MPTFSDQKIGTLSANFPLHFELKIGTLSSNFGGLFWTGNAMFMLILLHFFKMTIINFIVPSFVAFGNVKNNILSGGCPNLF